MRCACALVNLSRTVAAYKPKDAGRDDAMRVRLAVLAVEHPRYGHLMLHAMLKMDGLVVNRKRAYRLYRDMGLQVRRRACRKLRRSRSHLPPQQRVNQRWSMNFISDQLAGGRRFRVFNVIDDYSRECLGSLVDVPIGGQARCVIP